MADSGAARVTFLGRIFNTLRQFSMSTPFMYLKWMRNGFGKEHSIFYTIIGKLNIFAKKC